MCVGGIEGGCRGCWYMEVGGYDGEWWWMLMWGIGGGYGGVGVVWYKRVFFEFIWDWFIKISIRKIMEYRWSRLDEVDNDDDLDLCELDLCLVVVGGFLLKVC